MPYIMVRAVLQQFMGTSSQVIVDYNHYDQEFQSAMSRLAATPNSVTPSYIREVKHDVYGRRQTAKVTSDFLFFSCNP